MIQLKHTLLVCCITSVFCSISGAADLTQSRYSIAFDQNGDKIDIMYTHPVIADTVVTSQGDGYNGTWYYYAALDRYIMWFYNGPYSTSEKGYVQFQSFVGAINGSLYSSYDLDLGWSTPEWTRGTTPPLQAEINSQAAFYLYTDTKSIGSIADSARTKMQTGSNEAGRSVTIDRYTPEWFFVSVRGKNVVIYRSLRHGSDGLITTETEGACCNQTTGDCYITTSASCAQGYTYLGDNSTCASCTTQQSNVDFGDAPNSYKTTLASNGARHYLSTGIHLGQIISGESDGQPSQNSNQDTGDDGIEFLSPLTPGQTANVRVTASTLGAINAWLDLNGDGDWDDLDEQIFIDEPVVAGDTSMAFFIPASATLGTSFTRFRFNTVGG